MKPVAVYAAVAIALAACTGSNGTANAHGDILAAVGKNTLTRTDLKKSMPASMCTCVTCICPRASALSHIESWRSMCV